ncbi:transcriptional regulator [Embleya sp. NPDC050154]|uniref:transcriptional regulator n=1 Tax=Embleya sp. NPDC050154 TaxID=3363988 RepID=UPI00379FDBAC
MAGDAGGKATELARSLWELWKRAGSPTYEKLVHQGALQQPEVELNTTSLGDWFNGRAVPADPVRFAFLVTWLEHEARGRDRAYVATPVAAWERRRGEAVRERRPAGRPHTTRTVEPASGGGGFVGRPVRDFTDAFALEVHRAIDAPEHARDRLPVLPAYVARDHDRVLGEAVRRAAGGESVMVTLVAGSSTGKTRACWEALQGVPDGWRLWHPIAPGRPEAAVAELSAVGPRTVVWLNEAQFYLEPAGIGERVAAELRELLRDRSRAPVLVLATLWPDPYWITLTTRPPTDRPDPHEQARALLEGTDLHVPETFTGADLAALRARASQDPRLANALTSGDDGRITQFLAGALALLKRYKLAPAGARAVIEAAMDARRLGHGPALRQAFLEDAADAYLTDHQSDALTDDWFEQALAYATNVAGVHGARAPLTRIRPRRRTRDTADEGATYRLADYLEQHARHTRSRLCPSASFWTAAHDHAHTTDDIRNLADAARERLRLRHAERLYRKAADARDPHALEHLTQLREQAGDLDGAERIAHEAADAGNTTALTRLAALRAKAGDRDNAERLYRKVADAGNAYALTTLAQLREQAGDLEDAERLYRKAADAGDTYALTHLARLRERAGDRDSAERIAHEAADTGNTYPLTRLAALREEAGDLDDVERIALKDADAKVTEALTRLAVLREQAGDLDDAERLYRKAADAGDADALRYLVELREAAGERDSAERLCHEAADTGHPYALAYLAKLREAAGDRDGAERLCHEAADAGDTTALTNLARLREKAGDRDGAERLYREAADTGDTDALTHLARLREEAGDLDGAERLYRELTDTEDAEDTITLAHLAGLRERAGDRDGAERLYREAADAGDTTALTNLARLRKKAGDRDGAERLCHEAADAGDTTALAGLARLRERAGDRDGAERLYREAADAGVTTALTNLARLREQAGDRGGAERIAHEAADAGYPYALTHLAELRKEAGDRHGAERLYREAADAGDTTALTNLARLREQAGDRGGAERIAHEAADAGNTTALTNLARLREAAGGRDGAERLFVLLRRGLDADDDVPPVGG